MTHQSQTHINPTLHFGGLWGWFPELDRTQWRWEAPTSRAEKQNTTALALPSWLLELESSLTEEDAELVVNNAAKPDLSQENSGVERNIQKFREKIRNSLSQRDLERLSLSYLLHLKQDFTLGLISGEDLKTILRDVTQEFRDVSAQWNCSADGLLTSFYVSVWEGLTACNVLQPTDFEGSAMNLFLLHVACLPFNERVRDLAAGILVSTSTKQHLQMESSIIAMVNAWSKSWLRKEYVVDCRSSLRAAELAVVEAGLRLARLNFDIMLDKLHALEDNAASQGAVSWLQRTYPRRRFLSKPAKTWRSIQTGKRYHFVRAPCTKSSVIQAENSINKAEEVLWPKKLSTKKLATALNSLPLPLLTRIIQTCSDNIATAGVRQRITKRKRLGYRWLSTISQMPQASDELFLDIWKKFDITKHTFSEAGWCNLILKRWISRGFLSRPTEVETWFAISNKQDFASLLFALDKFKEMQFTRTRGLFHFLDEFGRFKKVYTILLRMRNLGMKLPATILRQSVEIISKYDNSLAIRTYRLRFLLHKDRLLNAQFLGIFVTALINDPKIHPARIWAFLNIPMYEKLPHSGRHFTREPLHECMVEVISIMASEFARCEFRPRRVVLRNVLNCLYHLRLHNAKITPELSKALAHIGITREIRGGQYVGQERLRYIISMIEKIEGKRVAQQVDGIVFDWRLYLTEKSVRERREGNVLRAGPID